MEWLVKFKDYLKGKKTYSIAGIVVLTIVYYWSQGQLGNLEALMTALTATGAATLRAGVAKVEEKVSK